MEVYVQQIRTMDIDDMYVCNGHTVTYECTVMYLGIPRYGDAYITFETYITLETYITIPARLSHPGVR